MNRFILNRMRQSATLSTTRYCWGILYEQTAEFIQFLPMGISTLLLFLGFCYFPSLNSDFIFLLPLMMMVRLRIPIRFSLLLPVGRMGRFWGAMAVIVSITGLVITLYLVQIGLSHLLAHILPDISWQKSTFTFHAINGFILYAALTLLPFFFASHILFPRYTWWGFFAIVMPSFVFINAIMLNPNWMARLSLATVASGLLIPWALLFLLLLHICQRRSLVGQKA